MTDPLLAYVANRVSEYQRGAGERPVNARTGVNELTAMVGGPLPDGPTDPAEAVRQLADAVDAGSVATIGPRYFGFVTGGAYPATVAADWLATGADQNVAVYVMSPVGAVVEDVAAGWLRDIFGLPRDASAGFTTGAMMANFTGLAAARHHVLAKAGWDVEADGLQGAPRVHVVVGSERHATIDASLRYLGLGHGTAHVVAADEEGRLRADLLAGVLTDCDGPTIVCAQAGNVTSGGFDPIAEICELAQAHGAWVHVDGAFGLWAAASPSLRGLVTGIDQADSWATDAHKWLNVPYDSRRARGLAVWAALRTLGRSGVADLVDRCCALARRFAEQLAAVPGVEVLNDVVLNQVVVRFGDSDDTTRRVIAAAQADGTSWFGGTVWRGVAAARISVSNWSTTEADVDRSVAAIRGVLDRITSRA